MYSIYHIPGIKIGCTDNVDRRLEQQGYSNCEILEEHTDIYVASDREIALQKQYGYRVDSIPYYESVNRWGAKAGRIGGKNAQKTLKKNNLAIYTKDKKLRLDWIKLTHISVMQKYGKEHFKKMRAKSNCVEKSKEVCCKKIIGTDKNNNKIQFNSITEASKYFNVSITAISNNLRGLTKYTKNYNFEYD
jgi:hypothetical protein